MAGAFIGVSGVARKVKQPYIGVSSVARKAIIGYIGVSGVARKFFDNSGLALPAILYESGTFNSNFTFDCAYIGSDTSSYISFNATNGYIQFTAKAGVTVKNCSKLYITAYTAGSASLNFTLTYGDGTTTSGKLSLSGGTVTVSANIDTTKKVAKIYFQRTVFAQIRVSKIWLE